MWRFGAFFLYLFLIVLPVQATETVSSWDNPYDLNKCLAWLTLNDLVVSREVEATEDEAWSAAQVLFRSLPEMFIFSVGVVDPQVTSVDHPFDSPDFRLRAYLRIPDLEDEVELNLTRELRPRANGQELVITLTAPAYPIPMFIHLIVERLESNKVLMTMRILSIKENLAPSWGDMTAFVGKNFAAWITLRWGMATQQITEARQAMGAVSWYQEQGANMKEPPAAYPDYFLDCWVRQIEGLRRFPPASEED